MLHSLGSVDLERGADSVLDVKRLQVLLSVVELGSVTAAADALMYTPSAVSQQLRRLEREVGQPLMKRHARGMSPTEAGQVLVLHARKVMRQLAAAEADLQEIAGLRRGRLVLGTFPTIASSFLPLVVRRFQQLHPAIRLDILSGREAQLVEWLENGTVDLSLLWDYEWRRLDPAQLDLTKLFDDPTVLVVAADHRLARRRRVEMAELADEDWIVRSRPPGRRGAAAQCRRGRVRAEGLVPGQRLPGGPGDGRGRARHRRGAADGGAQPDRQRAGHPARAARCRPAGSSSPTAPTGWTRPPRPRSTQLLVETGATYAPD